MTDKPTGPCIYGQESGVDVVPFSVVPRSKRVIAMPEGAAEPAVIDLNGKRSPVTYTVRLKQWHDGRMAIWVQDVADSAEDRRRVAVALRDAADAIERGAEAVA